MRLHSASDCSISFGKSDMGTCSSGASRHFLAYSPALCAVLPPEVCTRKQILILVHVHVHYSVLQTVLNAPVFHTSPTLSNPFSLAFWLSFEARVCFTFGLGCIPTICSSSASIGNLTVLSASLLHDRAGQVFTSRSFATSDSLSMRSAPKISKQLCLPPV